MQSVARPPGVKILHFFDIYVPSASLWNMIVIIIIKTNQGKKQKKKRK